MENKKTIWVIAGIILIGIFISNSLGLFSITGLETMSRSIPTELNPGESFTVNYIAAGVSGSWGATIEDSFVCNGYSDQNKKFVMISDEGSIKSVQYTAPSGENIQCSFTGNYQYGSQVIKTFTTQTVKTKITTISHSYSQCYDNDVYWYNSKGVIEDKKEECNVAGCANNACRVQLNEFDTDYNGQISRTELGIAISQWISGATTRSKLGETIQYWANG